MAWLKSKVCNGLQLPSFCGDVNTLEVTLSPTPSISVLSPSNSSLLDKEYFQIQSMQSMNKNGTKWCLEAAFNEGLSVKMTECNISSNLQWWSTDSIGEFRPFISNGNCLSKVPSKPHIAFENCDESKMTMFMYNPLQQVILWFKSGTKVNRSKFRGLTWSSHGTNDQVTVSNLLDGKRHFQQWEIVKL